MNIIRTERGWAGHYILADRCHFRRNTLLEKGDLRIIVSTIGNLRSQDGSMEPIGIHRWYETKVFHARAFGPYWDIDVSREIHALASKRSINGKSPDDLPDGVDMVADAMHETMVFEIITRLEKGDLFPDPEEEEEQQEDEEIP